MSEDQSKQSNPFAAPQASTAPPIAPPGAAGQGVGGKKRYFSHYAAMYSCVAPLVMMLLGRFNMFVLDRFEGRVALAYLAVSGMLSLVLLFTSPVLAIVGLVGGFRRKAAGTIVFGVIGTLLNLLLVGGMLVVILMVGFDAI